MRVKYKKGWVVVRDEELNKWFRENVSLPERTHVSSVTDQKVVFVCTDLRGSSIYKEVPRDKTAFQKQQTLLE